MHLHISRTQIQQRIGRKSHLPKLHKTGSGMQGPAQVRKPGVGEIGILVAIAYIESSSQVKSVDVQGTTEQIVGAAQRKHSVHIMCPAELLESSLDPYACVRRLERSARQIINIADDSQAAGNLVRSAALV